MKTTTTPKNYEQKLTISEFDADRIKKEWYSSSVHDMAKSPVLFAKGYGMTPKEAKQSAQRIVKCLNNEYKIDMHEELIDKIKVFVHYANTANKSLENGSKAECFGMLEGIIKQGNELLKQAKQK